MSSRLERLGSRVLGRAPSLAPRTVARFESMSNDAAALPMENTLRPASAPSTAPPRTPAPVVRIEKETRPATHPPPAPAPPPPATRPFEERAVAPEPAAPASPVAPTSSPILAPVERPAPPSGPPTPPVKIVEHERTLEKTVFAASAPPPEPTRDTAGKRDLDSELRRLREWMSAPAPESPSPAAPAPSPPRTRATSSVSAFSLPMRPPSAEPLPVAPPAPAPIEINIGTILVRATTPESKPARSAAPASHAAAGLAHFLARRSAGLP